MSCRALYHFEIRQVNRQFQKKVQFTLGSWSRVSATSGGDCPPAVCSMRDLGLIKGANRDICYFADPSCFATPLTVYTHLAYNIGMVFIETSIFTKRITESVSDEDYHRLQVHLAEHPDAGDLIRGAGGIRKIRCAASGRGKRGGAPTIWRT